MIQRSQQARLTFKPAEPVLVSREILARRAVPGVERVDARGCARTVGLDDGHAVICVRALDDEDALEFRVRGAKPTALFRLSSTAHRAFDLDADPERIALAFRHDSLLAPLIKRCPGLRIAGAWNPFECAVRAVLGQQVSVAAGRTLAARLVVSFGQPIAALPAPADVKAPPSDAKKTSSGLAYKVIKAGTGKKHPSASDSVTVHYTGWPTDGNMFASSVTRNMPATFPLNRVIAGWTEGVQLMVEGEKTRFWIPEKLAYQGERPPLGMLVFDVELIKIE